MKIAIIGTGAMGSIYAARFSKAGHEVIAIDIWKDHVDYINKNGLMIEGPDGTIIAKNIQASTKILDWEKCDFCVIATKALNLEESIKNLKDQIDLNTPIITIQNGLGAADIVMKHMPKNEIILGVAEGFGASLKAPGHVIHTANKQIRLGLISKKRKGRKLEIWKYFPTLFPHLHTDREGTDREGRSSLGEVSALAVHNTPTNRPPSRYQRLDLFL